MHDHDPIRRFLVGNLTAADLADLKSKIQASRFEDRRQIVEMVEDAQARMDGYRRAAGAGCPELVAVIEHGRLLEIRPAA